MQLSAGAQQQAQGAVKDAKSQESDAAKIAGLKDGKQASTAAALAEAAQTSSLASSGGASKSDLGVTKSADRSPLTQKTSASLNTGAQIAGLKPWSKDWVFTGTEDSNPDLKTLIGSKDSQGPQSILRQTRGDGAQSAKLAEAALLAAASGNPKLSAELEAKLNAQMQGLSAAQAGGQKPGVKAKAGADDASSTGDAWAQAEAIDSMQAGSQNSGATGAGSYGALSGAEYVMLRNGLKAADGSDVGADADSNSGGGSQSQTGPELRMIKGGLKGKSMGQSAELPSFGSKLKLEVPAGFKPKSGLGDNSDLLGSSELAGAAGAQAMAARGSKDQGPAPLMMNAHVVKGAGSRERLASATLINVGSEIRNLTELGGGEMKLRLKPDNLGELHVRVMTRGNEVGLKIMASDERSKQILEQSIGYLKESLASQNLHLSKWDLSVASAQSHAGANNGGQSDQQYQNSGQNQSADQFNNQAGLMRQNSGQDHSGRSNWDRYDSNDVGGTQSVSGARRSHVSAFNSSALNAEMAGARSMSGSAAASGRLDVMA